MWGNKCEHSVRQRNSLGFPAGLVFLKCLSQTTLDAEVWADDIVTGYMGLQSKPLIW